MNHGRLLTAARRLNTPEATPRRGWSRIEGGGYYRGKRRIEVRIGFQPDALQREVLADETPRKLCIWGRQRGKTTTAILWLNERAWQYPGTAHWYVGPTYKQAKRAAWERGIKKLIPRSSIASKPNESELRVTLVNGSQITILGADDPDSLRGPSLHSVVLDEYATMRAKAWTQAISPMLSTTRGHALFIGTPNAACGPHMAELFRHASSGRARGWRYWHASSLNAAHIDPDFIEDARRTMRDWEFRQELGAEFLEISGRVWPEFKDMSIVEGGTTYTVGDSGVKGATPAPRGWTVVAGVDFGWTHPTAVVWVAVGPSDQCAVVAEYSASHGRADEHAKHIKAISALYGGVHAIQFVGDPSQPHTIAEYAKEGIMIATANNAVEAGVDRVGRMLSHGYLTVASCCETLRDRMLHYIYDPKASRPRILKVADDECDALRYAIMAASPPENMSGGDDADAPLGGWDQDPVFEENWDLDRGPESEWRRSL